MTSEIDGLSKAELLVRLDRIGRWSPEDGRGMISRIELARRIKRHIEHGDDEHTWITAGRQLLKAIAREGEIACVAKHGREE